MTRVLTLLATAVLAAFLTTATALAQSTVWVQIEARPNAAQAEDRARAYASLFPDVSSFRLTSGWYAIALGPYPREDAALRLSQLRSQGLIPRDSFIADGGNFRDRIFGVPGSSNAALTPEATPEVIEIRPSTETVAEARDSERLLTREERAELQTALQWEGFYNSTIDASFGRGTRNAMAAWQGANGYEATGVLTTRQRRALLEPLREMRASLDLTPVIDRDTGISIDLPLGMVALDAYQPPFAQFAPTTDDGARVLLISQTGDAATLQGLFDVMQTLEIVPLEGERAMGRRSFTLTGQNDQISTHVFARLDGETVKGFALVWPAGDERRRRMALTAMEASFTPIDGVLPDTAGSGAQSVDLLSGLRIRQPERTRSGFYVDARGGVLTTAAGVVGCGRITLDEDVDATVEALDADLGLALLRPVSALAPIEIARLTRDIPRLQSEVAVSGYSFGGLLGAPTITFGALAELQGLDGNELVERLALAAEDGDAGGPVFDATGAVLGILLDKPTSGRLLPADVSFAVDADVIAGFLSDNGVSAAASDAADALHPQDLARLGADITVLVSCWN